MLRLTWRAAADSVDADIERQPLSRVLATLARQTGWQVFREPGPDRLVSTAFRRLAPREALPRLLGDLNHALVRGTNGTTRLLVYRTEAGTATLAVDAEAEGAIRHQLVVRLQDGVDAAALARSLGATLKGSLDGMNIHLLEFKDPAAAAEARKKLAGNPEVAGVEYNHRYRSPESSETTTWNAALAGAGQLQLRPARLDGHRLLVGLIDTEVQPLGARFDAFLAARESVVPGQGPAHELRHGTSMYASLLKAAEVALGPDAAAGFGVVSVNVYGDRESTSSFDVARGIIRAVDKGAGIIPLSLGSREDSAFLHEVIRRYQDQGVLFLGAAGNEPVATPNYPAAFPEVLAVSAGRPDGAFAPYANRGGFVDLMLPGTSVVPFDGDYWRVTGTSVATARAGGVAAALWQQQPTLKPTQLEPTLREGFGLKTAPPGRP